jgi:hypothetical protein
MTCGYQLRGLDLRGRCPECGTSVRRSFAHARLRAADAPRRERILSMAIIGGVLVVFVGGCCTVSPWLVFEVLLVSLWLPFYLLDTAGDGPALLAISFVVGVMGFAAAVFSGARWRSALGVAAVSGVVGFVVGSVILF